MNVGKRLRQFSQIIFLAGFVILLSIADAPDSIIPRDLFLRADPLAGLTTALAFSDYAQIGGRLVRFLPALGLLVVTAAFGRFFCGWICPLGACIDITHALFVHPFSKKDRPGANRPRLKYYVLAVAIGAAVMGAHLSWIADPIPLMTRAFGGALIPLAEGPTGQMSVGAAVKPVQWGALGLFVAILGLTFISRRYWCRSLCPLGAMLGVLARFSLWRRRVSEECVECGICTDRCPMGAIPQNQPEQTRTGECILCYECLDCPQDATTIGVGSEMQDAEDSPDADRRMFLGVLIGGILYGLIGRHASGIFAAGEAPIRPPGAHVRGPDGRYVRMMNERELRSQCVRCGECMAACPTDIIKPAPLGMGPDGVFTPVLEFDSGYCEPGCTVCGDVCPTGALRAFTSSEKADIRIGVARIDHQTCLAWGRGDAYVDCTQCYRMCPYAAIVTETIDGKIRPVMHPEKCVGCGHCKLQCPVEPVSAIRVSGRNDTDD